MARAALLFICLLGLSGCGVVAAGFVGANVATLIHTDKTIPDIVLSERRGKSCSLLHAARNQPYCQPAPPDPAETLAELADNRYCYRTLGRIDCYNRPDFLASGHTRVNFATGYLPPDRAPAPLAQRQAKGEPMAGIPAPAETIAPAPAAIPASKAKGGPKKAPLAKPGKGAPAALSQPSRAAKAAGEDGAPPKDTPAMTASTTRPAPMDPRLTGTPLAQVPPPVPLPGQGTY